MTDLKEVTKTYIDKYYDDPLLWIEKVLRVHLWSKQREIVESVFNNRRTTVRACHSSGKTFEAACAVLAFIFLRPPAKIVTTGPSWYQVRFLLWSEINHLFKTKLQPLGFPGEVFQTMLSLAEHWFAVGISPKDDVNFQGFHQKNVLVIFDEAPGVREEIAESADSLLASGNAHLLKIGNPTKSSGHFYNDFRDPSVKTFHISAFDTPNYTGEVVSESLRSQLINEEWVQDKKTRWGEDSPLYVSRVLANFPHDADERQLISLALCEDAVNRDIEPTGEKEMGLDIARFGCLDDQTEVLTDNGWKFFNNLTGNELILCLENGVAKWGSINKIYKYYYEGFMNLYDGAKVNFCVTDNHKFFVRISSRNNNYIFREFKDLPQEFAIRNIHVWHGYNPNKIDFVSSVNMPNGGKRIKQWTFDFTDWAEFLGWFISEGNVYKEKRLGGRYRIMISQKNGAKCTLIKNLLSKMHLSYRVVKKTSQVVQIEFSNNEIGKHLLEYCGKGASNKKIPKYIKEATPLIMNAFLSTFLLGDGYVSSKGTQVFTSSSKQLIDDIQEICVKLSQAGKIKQHNFSGTTFLIEGRKCIRQYSTFRCNRKKTSTDIWVNKSKIQRIPYKGYIYCLSTPTHIFMVRRKGCAMWSGNSDNTCYVIRQGKAISKLLFDSKRDTMEVAGRAKRIYEDENISRIKADEIGVGGGVVDRLTEQGINIIGVNSAENSIEPDRYFNKRTEMWFNAMEWLKTGKIPDDDLLIRDLTAVRFEYTSKGQYKLEPKDQTKKRLGYSPDRGDAFVLAIHHEIEKIHEAKAESVSYSADDLMEKMGIR